ncbi:MAG: TraR/DksA family transcriptional regulator [Bdellovibrionaceae bacterium]|nr:TraR/DksA family transcriptional regulator [Pseudobdellovibrionaceae bacterium]
MKLTDMQFFKSFLIEQKSSILNKTAEFKSEQREEHERLSEDAEVASADATLNLSLQQMERQRATLFQIERALSKISDGTYGQCESCGSEIGIARLRARPFTPLCIECMEDQEDQRHHPLH